MKAKRASRNEDNAKEPVLCMAADLDAKKWNLAFCGPRGSRQVTLDAWDCEGANRELAKAKTKVGLPAAPPAPAVQEAGRDGFLMHRFFETLSIQRTGDQQSRQRAGPPRLGAGGLALGQVATRKHADALVQQAVRHRGRATTAGRHRRGGPQAADRALAAGPHG